MNILMLLELAAAMDPQRIALGSSAEGRTTAGLLDLSGRAGGLLAGSERPVIYADVASAALPVALLGAAWAGRPFVPVSYRLADERLRALIEAQAPAFLIAGPVVAARLDGIDGIEVIAPDDFLLAVTNAAAARDRWPDESEAPALLLHTSGTTGAPKVAVLRHSHLTAYVLATVEPMSVTPTEATLVSVPPYHIAGIMALLSSTYAGRRVVQLPAFDPGEWVDTVRAEGITHAMVVPTMLHRIIPLLEDGDGLPTLRHLSYGGGRMPLPLIERALELLPQVDFVNAYGLTETSSTLAVLGPEEHRHAIADATPEARRRLGSVGRPTSSVEVEVRHGQIWVRGGQVSGEYSHGGGTDEEGWFATGDGGWIDDAGYLFVEGRLDDVIVRGGENLSPGEIEDVLLDHPAVADVAVFGLADEQWGEVPAAAIVSAPGAELSGDDVRAWVAERLRSSRAPAVVRFVPDLPRTDTGKVLRRVLREDFGAAAADD